MKGFVIAALVWGLLSVSLCEGRPLVTDDAGVVEQGKVELETGDAQDRFKEADWSSVPMILTYGLFQGLEVGAEIPYLASDPKDSGREKGVGDLKLATKYQFAKEGRWLPALSLTATFKLPTASRKRELGTGRADVDLSGILSKGMGPFQFYLNCGNTFVGRASGLRLKDVFHGGFGLEWKLGKRWTAVSEIFGARPSEAGGKSLLATNVGLVLSLGPGLVLDMALGRGLRSRTVGPEINATAGLTWTFGF